MNYVRLVVSLCWQGVIPWIVAALIKKLMTAKGYKILSIIFAIIPCGLTYEALQRAGASEKLALYAPIILCVVLYFLIKTVGFAILRKRNMLTQ